MVLEKKGMIGDALQEASLDEIANAIAKGHDLNKLMRNLRFIRPDGSLTVAAMLLFGKYTQRWLPVMTAKCISYAGNSIGGKVFRDKVNDAVMEGNLLPYTDAGSGIQRALEEGAQVEFTNDERIHEFLITIKRNEDLDTVSNTKQFDLDTISTINSPDLDTTPDTFNLDLDTKRRKLTNKEKDIVLFCSVPRSTKEILDRVGVSMHTKNREKYVTSLVEAGYLEMTNPDNSTAHNQKCKKKQSS